MVAPVLGDWSFDPAAFWATNDYDNAEFIPHCRPTLGSQNAVTDEVRRAIPCCEYPEGMVACVEQEFVRLVRLVTCRGEVY